MRLLLVEDHAPLAEAIDDALTRAGFALDRAASIQEARAAMSGAQYVLALLDLGLPDGSGLDLLKEWQETTAMPVIVLTARGALGDRIDGLDSGADDYIVKPVEMPELIARCRAVLRRPGSRLSVVIETGGLRVDTAHREATYNGEVLSLGRREFGVLEALVRRKNRVVSRRILQDELYDNDDDVLPNAVDAAVSRLRRVLDGSGAPLTMHTVRGVGWMLVDGADR
ncbi:MAG: response regulator transcription factor [Pseudomonadota bacterium]